MIRLQTVSTSAALGLLILLAAAPANAATRTYAIGSFDRIRVEGPFDVQLATMSSPGASAEGDSRVADDLDVRVEGTTLIVRAGVSGWGEQQASGERIAPVVRVSTQLIRSATIIGGGRLKIAGPLAGQRIDLRLTGSGSLDVTGLDADLLFVTVLGSGDVTLAGRAARVQLSTSGPGRIIAPALIAGDLTIRLDGNGETRATARFTANVTTMGLGAATVYGSPACTVRAVAGGPISCGKLPAP